MTTIINLFGSPGSGKSTNAAELFAKMKRFGFKVELVTEYAKDITYRGDIKTLYDCQPLVFGEQHHRIMRCINIVDYIINDSPLLLSIIYGTHMPESFRQSCIDIFNTFNNWNFFLKLDESKYKTYGRNQTVSESKEISQKIFDMLQNLQIPFAMINDYDDIFRRIYTYEDT